MFVSGIASGLDTEALIQQLMAIERRPMVQLQERKTLLGQQRDAWRDINTRLNNFRERVAALRSESLYHARTTTSSATDVVSATAKATAIEGRYDIHVTQIAQAHRVASFAFADVEEALGFQGSFTINGVEMAVEEADSIKTIMQKINSAEDAGVEANIIAGRLVVRAQETGVQHEISFGGDLHLLAGEEGPDGEPTGLGFVSADWQFVHELNEAQDALFTIEGIEVTRPSNVIDDVVEGVTFTLHAAGAAKVSVAKDFDGIIQAVQAFVEQYNSVQSFISSARASQPEQGRRGLLAGDGLAMRIQSELQSLIMGTVDQDNAFPTLMSIGVSVDRYGKMSVDESKLRSALEEDAGAVHRLFGAENDSDGFDGVAARMESAFQGWLQQDTGLLAERQKMFGNQIRSIDQSMERLEYRLEMRERTLLRQFAALEDVLARFQTQAMWLDGQIQQMNAMTAAAGTRRQ